MDDTAGPPRTSDVAAMGSESDDATSSNSSKTRPVDDDDASPVSAGSVSDDEYRNRSSIRAASPESHAPAAAAVTTSCPTITTPSMPHPQPLPPGCGCVAAAADQDEITVCITPTTGGQFELAVDRNDTVENLKKIISKKLKVAKERICLLHRERQLREGTLAENGLQNDSRLTLLPSVETGLLAQRPEQSVMQALESLNDSQVNDFLSGKAPLNLTMRLGDHMMLIQLQLSTVTPATPTATQVSSTSGNGHNHHSNSNSSSSNSNVVGLSNSGNATSVSNLSGGHSSLQTTRRCLTAKSPANIVKPQNAAGAPAGRTSHLISNLASALHAAASYSSSSSSSSNSSNHNKSNNKCRNKCLRAIKIPCRQRQ